MDVRTGCSGWSYKEWVGPFYPPGSKQGDFLEMYSRAFDTVEIDSTFYHVPSEASVKSWAESTPDNFKFSAKMPKEITHEKRLLNVDRALEAFLSSIRNLGKKLGIVLIQFPPFFSHYEGSDKIENFLHKLPDDMKFAVEFRHDSWFREDIFSVLRENNITMAWSEVPMVDTPDVLTSSILYLRLVGDRSIQQKDFGTIQKDRTEVIRKWARRIDDKKDLIEQVYVFSNNHFQGFGPGTVNLIRKEFQVDQVDWDLKMRSSRTGRQETLF